MKLAVAPITHFRDPKHEVYIYHDKASDLFHYYANSNGWDLHNEAGLKSYEDAEKALSKTMSVLLNGGMSIVDTGTTFSRLQ